MSSTWINKNTNSYEIEKINKSYTYILAGNNKIEFFVKYDDEKTMKNCSFILNIRNKDNVYVEYYNNNDNLITEYQIIFSNDNKVYINNDIFILSNDSYKKLKNNILKNQDIISLLEFFKLSIFLYDKFDNIFDKIIFVSENQNFIKYQILSATLYFSMGQSDWIYTYYANYSYIENLIDEIRIFDEEGELFYKQKLEVNNNYLVYQVFKKISEYNNFNSYIFIDLNNKMFQETGINIHSCYEYLYQKSFIYF